MWLARGSELCLLSCPTIKLYLALFYKLDISTFQSIVGKLLYWLGGDF